MANSGKKKWADIHNAFDPIEPVPLDKLDKWYVERPGTPFKRLLDDLSPDRLPKRLLLVGHHASGKSTELLKLATELASSYGYFVVYVPLDYNIDIEKANPVDIIYLMGVALYQAARDNNKKEPERKYVEQLREDLETVVRTHTESKGFSINLDDLLKTIACLALGGAAAALGGPAAGALAAAGARLLGPKLRFSSGISTEVARKIEVEPQITLMVEHLNELIADFEAKNNCCLTLIVDGLDKPTDPAVILLNFAQKRFLAAPSCRVVYAAPMEIYYSPEYAATRRLFPPLIELPNIRLRLRHERTREDPEGCDFLRTVVRQRLGALGFDPDKIIGRQPLDRLVQASGGVMRDLITLVREAAGNAASVDADAINEDHAGAAEARIRRLYQATLDPHYRQILKTVRDTQQRIHNPDCDMLLRNNFILSYLNKDIWYDVHPILRDEDLT